MKIVIILVVLLALLGGGGFAAWTFLPEVVRPLLGMDLPEGMEPKPKPPVATSVVDIEPIILPLFEDGTVRRFFVMEISVEVYQPDGATLLQRQLPRLQDAYIVYLLSLQSRGISGLQDLAFLKDRLLKVTRDVLGPDVVHDILFKNVFERPVS